jgi:hypothetical protein
MSISQCILLQLLARPPLLWQEHAWVPAASKIPKEWAIYSFPNLWPSCVSHVCRPPIDLLHYCKVLLDYCIVVHSSLIIVLLLKLLYLILPLIIFCFIMKNSPPPPPPPVNPSLLWWLLLSCGGTRRLICKRLECVFTEKVRYFSLLDCRLHWRTNIRRHGEIHWIWW